MANVVTNKLIEEILPRYDFLDMIGSEKGPTFLSQVSQGIVTALGTDLKLHCAFRSQSSVLEERMKRNLKDTLTELALETGMGWVTLFSFVLFRMRKSPYQMGLTLFAIKYNLRHSLP